MIGFLGPDLRMNGLNTHAPASPLPRKHAKPPPPRSSRFRKRSRVRFFQSAAAMAAAPSERARLYLEGWMACPLWRTKSFFSGCGGTDLGGLLGFSHGTRAVPSGTVPPAQNAGQSKAELWLEELARLQCRRRQVKRIGAVTDRTRRFACDRRLGLSARSWMRADGAGAAARGGRTEDHQKPSSANGIPGGGPIRARFSASSEPAQALAIMDHEPSPRLRCGCDSIKKWARVPFFLSFLRQGNCGAKAPLSSRSTARRPGARVTARGLALPFSFWRMGCAPGESTTTRYQKGGVPRIKSTATKSEKEPAQKDKI